MSKCKSEKLISLIILRTLQLAIKSPLIVDLLYSSLVVVTPVDIDNLQVTTFLSINISTFLLGNHKLVSIYISYLGSCVEIRRRLREDTQVS